AVGLGCSWVVVFTLFPALQKVLRTPTEQERPTAGGWLLHLARWIPLASWRWRWPLVASSVALSACGAVALFGLPGLVAPMRILTDPVQYMNHSAPLYLDIQRFGPVIPGLSVTDVWLQGGVGSVSEPEGVTGLHEFQQVLEADPAVGAAIGPTTILRMVRYLGGSGDRWPTDAEERERLAAEFEGLVAAEPLLQRFVQPHALGQTHLTVVTRAAGPGAIVRVAGRVRPALGGGVGRAPRFEEFRMRIVGLAPLHAKMAQNLVPTLVESFALTVVIIFAAFLVVFRN